MREIASASSPRNFPLRLLPKQLELPCRYTENARWYVHPDGGGYKSVTSVIGAALSHEWLDEWRGRVGDEEADRVSGRAKTAGTAVHDLCERYVLDSSVSLDGDMPTNVASFRSIKRALDRHLDLVYGTEVLLRSDTLMTAGRTDLLGKWDGVDSVIDFKTSSRMKRADDILGYFLQETAYSIMAGETFTIEFPQIVTVIAVQFEEEPQVFVRRALDYEERVREIFIGSWQ